MEQKTHRLYLSKQENKGVSLFSFSLGHRARFYFPVSLAGRCPIWLSPDLWPVGRIDIVLSTRGPSDVQMIFSPSPAAIQMGKVPSPERMVEPQPREPWCLTYCLEDPCLMRKLSLGVLHKQKTHLYFGKPLKCWILVTEVVNLLWLIKQWSRQV